VEAEKISKELIAHGHEHDASWITRPLNEDETVASVLCGHSERLAIAFNFVENPNTKRIQVTKNLRVCGDCRECLFNLSFSFLIFCFLHRSSDKINSCYSSM
jgi:hypothetical protein